MQNAQCFSRGSREAESRGPMLHSIDEKISTRKVFLPPLLTTYHHSDDAAILGEDRPSTPCENMDDDLNKRIRESDDGIIDLTPEPPTNPAENALPNGDRAASNTPARVEPAPTLATSPLRWDKYTLQATKRLIPKEVHAPDPTSVQGFYDPKSLSPDNPEPTFLQFIWDPEGFPTIDAVPIWERLVGEDHEHFEAFRRYLTLEKPRDLRTLALDVHGDVEVLIVLSNLWQWSIRAYHYDRFIEARIERKRTEIKIEVEDSHRKKAKKILDKALSALDQIDLDTITPDEAVKLAKLGFEAERISVGMEKEKPRETVPPQEVRESTPAIEIAGNNVQVNWKTDWKSN